jgi:GTP-binding protein HflX
MPQGGEALLVDTVGFLHKLPHGFVDAFKGTLEEVRSAHLLLHVVDRSDAHAGEQMEVVERVLEELQAASTPRLTVFNKADVVSLSAPLPRTDGPVCVVSARTGDGLPQLLRQIGVLLAAQQERLQVRIPLARADLVAAIHRAGRVSKQSVHDGEFEVIAYVPPKVAGRVRKALRERRRETGPGANPR